MAKIKTVNFRFMFWFGIVFAIGAVAVSLMGRSIIVGEVLIVEPMFLGIALFGLFGTAGFIGVMVLLCKFLILKIVLKHGTETVGSFYSIGRTIEWGALRSQYKTGKGTVKWFYQIIFTYMVDGEERKYKSCMVYLDEQVEKLEELKTFSVKYKGKFAIICEKV